MRKWVRGRYCPGDVGGLLGVAGSLSGTVSPFRVEQGTSLETPWPVPPPPRSFPSAGPASPWAAFLRPPKVPRHAGFPRGEHRGSRHRFL